MIKTIDNINLGNIDRMEKTGKVNQFKEWYNPIPSMFYQKQINLLITDFYSRIEKGKQNEVIDIIKTGQLEYLANLQIEVNEYRAVEMLFVCLLGNLTTLLRLKSFFRGRKLRMITERPDELRYACEKAKELTGKEISTMDDVFQFKEKVIERVQKLISYKGKLIAEEKNKGERVYIIAYAKMILNFIEETGHNVRKMIASDFIDYNNLALKKVAEIEKLQPKNDQ